jgi:hypothetical protein
MRPSDAEVTAAESAAPLLGKEQMKIRQRIDDEITATIRNYGGGLRGSEDHWDMLTEALVDAALALVAEQRKAERRRVADLLAEHAETLAAFAGDKADLVGLLALLLRLDTEPAS